MVRRNIQENVTERNDNRDSVEKHEVRAFQWVVSANEFFFLSQLLPAREFKAVVDRKGGSNFRQACPSFLPPFRPLMREISIPPFRLFQTA